MIDYNYTPPEKRNFFGFVMDIGVILFGCVGALIGNFGNIICTRSGIIALVAAGIIYAYIRF